MLLHRASFVVYQSRFCQEMSDRFLGRFAGPSAVVYNAVDTAMFSPAGRKPAANGAPLRLLAMGSHEDPVRVMAALDVVAALAAQGVSAVLTVAGRLAWPGADNDVKAAVALLGLQGAVTLRGPYTQREAGDILRSADILLHLKYADPCPTVVIEAMACGLPVVGSRSGGLPELVGDEAGALVPVPLDLEKLYVPPIADAVAAVRTVAASLEDFSSAARKRAVACFDKALWIEEHRRIFQQVLGS
ncbi:MAG: glycosyltransferase family 4 protein [Candidatus Omnitrophota bacterium]